MALTKLTNTGERITDFLLNDWTFYIMNTSATGGYVSTDWKILGYTDPEKNVTRTSEKYRKEAKIPRVQIYSKTIRKGLEITTALSHFDPELISVIAQGTVIDLGANTGTRVGFGTDEASLQYRAVMFSSTRDDGKIYNIVIPKAEVTQDGDQTLGGEEEARFPVRVVATYNPTATADRNVWYEDLLESTVNATALTAPGYN
jgi:hypothetical protein